MKKYTLALVSGILFVIIYILFQLSPVASYASTVLENIYQILLFIFLASFIFVITRPTVYSKEANQQNTIIWHAIRSSTSSLSGFTFYNIVQTYFWPSACQELGALICIPMLLLISLLFIFLVSFILSKVPTKQIVLVVSAILLILFISIIFVRPAVIYSSNIDARLERVGSIEQCGGFSQVPYGKPLKGSDWEKCVLRYLINDEDYTHCLTQRPVEYMPEGDAGDKYNYKDQIQVICNQARK